MVRRADVLQRGVSLEGSNPLGLPNANVNPFTPAAQALGTVAEIQQRELQEQIREAEIAAEKRNKRRIRTKTFEASVDLSRSSLEIQRDIEKQGLVGDKYAETFVQRLTQKRDEIISKIEDPEAKEAALQSLTETILESELKAITEGIKRETEKEVDANEAFITESIKTFINDPLLREHSARQIEEAVKGFSEIDPNLDDDFQEQFMQRNVYPEYITALKIDAINNPAKAREMFKAGVYPLPDNLIPQAEAILRAEEARLERDLREQEAEAEQQVRRDFLDRSFALLQNVETPEELKAAEVELFSNKYSVIDPSIVQNRFLQIQNKVERAFEKRQFMDDLAIGVMSGTAALPDSQKEVQALADHLFNNQQKFINQAQSNRAGQNQPEQPLVEASQEPTPAEEDLSQSEQKVNEFFGNIGSIIERTGQIPTPIKNRLASTIQNPAASAEEIIAAGMEWKSYGERNPTAVADIQSPWAEQLKYFTALEQSTSTEQAADELMRIRTVFKDPQALKDAMEESKSNEVTKMIDEAIEDQIGDVRQLSVRNDIRNAVRARVARGYLGGVNRDTDTIVKMAIADLFAQTEGFGVSAVSASDGMGLPGKNIPERIVPEIGQHPREANFVIWSEIAEKFPDLNLDIENPNHEIRATVERMNRTWMEWLHGGERVDLLNRRVGSFGVAGIQPKLEFFPKRGKSPKVILKPHIKTAREKSWIIQVLNENGVYVPPNGRDEKYYWNEESSQKLQAILNEKVQLKEEKQGIIDKRRAEQRRRFLESGVIGFSRGAFPPVIKEIDLAPGASGEF